MFTESFKCVSRRFKGSFRKVSRVLQGSVRENSRVFQERFKSVSSKMEGHFQGLGVSRVIARSLKRKFQWYFMGFSRKFQRCLKMKCVFREFSRVFERSSKGISEKL